MPISANIGQAAVEGRFPAGPGLRIAASAPISLRWWSERKSRCPQAFPRMTGA
jgi:hypothetical protein